MTREEVEKHARGTTARLIALRAYAVRAGFNPRQTVEALEALLAGPAPAPAPAPAEDVAAMVAAVEARILAEVEARLKPAPRVVTIREGVRRELPEGETAHAAVPELLIWLEDSHLNLVGPAGTGKTTLARQLATLSGRDFYSQGPLYKRSDFEGYTIGKNYFTTPFREAWERGGIILLDEADASDPAVLVALNQALANGECTFPDSPRPVARHESTRAVVSTNTWGKGASQHYVAREQQDAATVDRFAQFAIDYDTALEERIAPDLEWCKHVQALREAVKRVPGCDLLITPRATIMGGNFILRAVASGWNRRDAWNAAEARVVFRGAPRAVVDAVKKAAKGEA